MEQADHITQNIVSEPKRILGRGQGHSPDSCSHPSGWIRASAGPTIWDKCNMINFIVQVDFSDIIQGLKGIALVPVFAKIRSYNEIHGDTSSIVIIRIRRRHTVLCTNACAGPIPTLPTDPARGQDVGDYMDARGGGLLPTKRTRMLLCPYGLQLDEALTWAGDVVLDLGLESLRGLLREHGLNRPHGCSHVQKVGHASEVG